MLGISWQTSERLNTTSPGEEGISGREEIQIKNLPGTVQEGGSYFFSKQRTMRSAGRSHARTSLHGADTVFVYKQNARPHRFFLFHLK